MPKAAQENLILYQMDVKTAYLHASIDCKIYIDRPEGYVKQSLTGKKASLQVAQVPLWTKTV